MSNLPDHILVDDPQLVTLVNQAIEAQRDFLILTPAGSRCAGAMKRSLPIIQGLETGMRAFLRGALDSFRLGNFFVAWAKAVNSNRYEIRSEEHKDGILLYFELRGKVRQTDKI